VHQGVSLVTFCFFAWGGNKFNAIEKFDFESDGNSIWMCLFNLHTCMHFKEFANSSKADQCPQKFAPQQAMPLAAPAIRDYIYTTMKTRATVAPFREVDCMQSDPSPNVPGAELPPGRKGSGGRKFISL